MRLIAFILAESGDWSWAIGLAMLVIFGILGAIGKRIQKKAEEEQARKNQQRVRDISRREQPAPAPRRAQVRPVQAGKMPPLPTARPTMQVRPVRQGRPQAPPPIRPVRPARPARPALQPRPARPPAPPVQEQEEAVHRTVTNADQPMAGMGKGVQQAVQQLQVHVAEQLPQIEALPAAHLAIGAKPQLSPQPRQTHILVSIANQTEAMKAVIFAEVLGKPKALRQEPEAWQP